MSPLLTDPVTFVGTRPVKATAATCGALRPEFMLYAGLVETTPAIRVSPGLFATVTS